MIPNGARVADIGADHGYLGIYLLQTGVASFVTASDVREQPLDSARANAARFGMTERMDFVLCDGLSGLTAETADAFVICGMGGDTIARILDECPWAADPRYTWVLQPNTSANDLRRYLGEHGWRIEQERLIDEGKFIYNLLQARYGGGTPLSPGEQYVSPQLLRDGGAALEPYFSRVLRGLARAVEGIAQSDRPELRDRLAYYQTAYREVCEMREHYANRPRD
jgi:tRNA (adenine22-N1)-methyltransferase